jgi:hypothetical protein
VCHLLVTPSLKTFCCSFEHKRDGLHGAGLLLNQSPGLLDSILKTLKLGPKGLKMKSSLAMMVILKTKD